MCECCHPFARRGVSGRRGFLAQAAALGGAALLPGRASAQGATAAVPRSAEYLLKGGMVVTMDPALGDFLAADVHVRDGAIVAVGPELAAPGAEVVDAEGMIVMPGLIETHWHMWNSLFKNMVRRGRGYVDLKNALGRFHTPEDFYNAVRLAMTEAIDAGITTVLNYAHNTLSGAHVDAEIRAMVESGLRGRYAYGGADPTPRDQLMDVQDALRAHRQWFTGRHEWTGRVEYGFSVRAPGGLPDRWREEFRAARDNGLPIILHGGQSAAFKAPVELMHREGWIDRSMIFVHSLLFTEADRRILVETGASNSISLANEFPHGQRDAAAAVRQQMMLQLRDGVNVCLSFDASSLSRASMLEQMRLCFSTLNGEAGTPTAGIERVTHTKCIEMATMNGARALGKERQIGSLTPGKRADIIMLRASDLNMAPVGELHSTIVHSADNQNVDTVIVDGRFLKRGGRILSVDVEDVRRKAVRSLYDIRLRAGGDIAPPTAAPPRY
jgi:cytosine/adenosine deaminase-related metal-dependent hydrolase